MTDMDRRMVILNAKRDTRDDPVAQEVCRIFLAMCPATSNVIWLERAHPPERE